MSETLITIRDESATQTFRFVDDGIDKHCYFAICLGCVTFAVFFFLRGDVQAVLSTSLAHEFGCD